MQQQAEILLEQGAEKCGNYSRLAEVLGVSRMLVSQWKSGAKPCPPEDQARIADLVGLDPVEALLNAHIERHAGTPKGEALCRTLGKWLPRNKNAPDIASEALNWRKRSESNQRTGLMDWIFWAIEGRWNLAG